jgi:hypothetical protein
MSLLVRERGLKRPISYYLAINHLVAPRTGAWIETEKSLLRWYVLLSLLVRERGLKHEIEVLEKNPAGRSSYGSVD